MKIIFDLDGVLRNLVPDLCFKFNVPLPQQWVFEIRGKSLYKIIEEEKFQPLIECKPTEYLEIVKSYFDIIEIWSSQPEAWIPYTKLWLDKNIGDEKYSIEYLSTEEKRKRLDTEPDFILVEDSPNFSDYERIVLIDREYNRGVNALRVSNPTELNFFLKVIKYGQW